MEASVVTVVVAAAAAAVVVLYRRSEAKLRREGRQMRGMGDFRRHRRDVRSDMRAWEDQQLMGRPPTPRAMPDGHSDPDDLAP